MTRFERYLSVEDPSDTAVVDFLSRGVGVTLTVESDGIRIVSRVSHGEGSSSWDEHESFVPFHSDTDSVSE